MRKRGHPVDLGHKPLVDARWLEPNVQETRMPHNRIDYGASRYEKLAPPRGWLHLAPPYAPHGGASHSYPATRMACRLAPSNSNRVIFGRADWTRRHPPVPGALFQDAEIDLQHQDEVQRGMSGYERPQVTLRGEVHQAQRRSHDRGADHPTHAPFEMDQAEGNSAQ